MGTSAAVIPIFGIRILPYMRQCQQMYLPRSSVGHWNHHIPNRVSLFLPNGDVFKIRYCSEKSCFIGLRPFFNRYGFQKLSILYFSYFGEGCFSVSVFTNAAVEIDYPCQSIVDVASVPQLRHIPDIMSFTDSFVTTFEDHVSRSLLSYNAKAHFPHKLEIHMLEQASMGNTDYVYLDDLDDVFSNKWNDGSMILVEAGGYSWNLFIQKNESGWFIVRGWKKFVSDLRIGPSDVVVFYTSGLLTCLNVALFREYCSDSNFFSAGRAPPVHFLKIATDDMIRSGEMGIPMVFYMKYFPEFDREVELQMVGGRTFQCFYDAEEQKFVALTDFFTAVAVKAGFTLVFVRVGSGQVSVTVLNEELVLFNEF